MKFYKDTNYNNYYFIITVDDLNAIYCNTSDNTIIFFKNGEKHNAKNAALIRNEYKIFYKQFYLSGKLYGYEDKFTKQSWRKFVKLQVFL